MQFSSTERIFLKDVCYGCLSFTRNIGKNIDKDISKNLTSKYSQKLLDHAKESATDGLKTTSKRAIQKTAEATGDLISNKIAYKITRVSKLSPQNNSVTNEEEISKERDVSLEQRQKVIELSEINVI